LAKYVVMSWDGVVVVVVVEGLVVLVEGLVVVVEGVLAEVVVVLGALMVYWVAVWRYLATPKGGRSAVKSARSSNSRSHSKMVSTDSCSWYSSMLLGAPPIALRSW
jgi:hypothetical protein